MLACNTLSLKMNLGNVLLIIFMMAFPFSLKGAEASNKVVYGLLGESVLLPVPEFTGTLDRIQWNKLDADKSSAGKMIGRKTTWNNETETKEKYKILNNGSLRIDKLEKEDAGNYKVQGHNKARVALFKETFVDLEVHEPLPHPQIIVNCSKKELICQVESNTSRIITAKLFQNNKVKTLKESIYCKVKWCWTFHQANLSGKFKCAIASGHLKNHIEEDINCLGTGLPFDLIYLVMIGGGVVIFIISMALIVYCVRKKRRERHEIEDQERELQVRIADDDLKRRKLPQVPVHSVPHQAQQQQQRRPLLHPDLKQEGHPPQPCPRPPQRKLPRPMKERP